MFIQVCFSKEEVEGFKKFANAINREDIVEKIDTHQELSIENTLVVDSKPMPEEDVHMINLGMDVSVTECILDYITKVAEIIRPIVDPICSLIGAANSKFNEFANRKFTYKVNGEEIKTGEGVSAE